MENSSDNIENRIRDLPTFSAVPQPIALTCAPIQRRVERNRRHGRQYIHEFDVHVTVHRVKFLIIKPTRCTNFSNLFFE